MFTYSHNGIVVNLLNNNISNNINTLSGSTMASALSVYTIVIENALPHVIPKLVISNSHFIANRHLVSKPTTTVSVTSHVLAFIHDCNFTDNYGSAITAYTTTVDHLMIIFSGKVLFRNNTSHRGGAIHLFKSRIGLKKELRFILKITLPKMSVVQFMCIPHNGSVAIMILMLETMVTAFMYLLIVIFPWTSSS